MRNLKFVFPEKSLDKLEVIFDESLISIARLLSDLFRIPKLDQKWIDENVDTSQLKDILAAHPNETVLFLSGHLGSFELFLHVLGNVYGSVAYIARSFNNQGIDDWWNGRRQLSGNVLIPRKGATRHVLTKLAAKQHVGFLFDQNLTRDKAVFVPWFGKLAATTKTAGLAVYNSACPVIVLGMTMQGERYKILAEYVNFSELLKTDKTYDEKCYEITAVTSEIFQKMILQYPEGWFWMHRRWKTSPVEGQESFYKDL